MTCFKENSFLDTGSLRIVRSVFGVSLADMSIPLLQENPAVCFEITTPVPAPEMWFPDLACREDTACRG